MRLTSLVAAVLLFLVAAFQLALVAGAPWGAASLGGTYDGALPWGARIGAACSAVVLVAMALLVLRVGGLAGGLGVNTAKARTWLWIAAALIVLSGVVNAVGGSGWERGLMAPVAIVAATCMAITAVLAARATPQPARR